MTTKEKADLSRLDKDSAHIVDLYRRTRDVYQRTTAAMGRGSRYRVTMASTTAVGNAKHKTS